MFNNENSILNIGSVAFDSLEIRGKHYDKVVGGSATYFSLAASLYADCLLYTSPSPRDRQKSRMPSSA